MAPGPGLPGDGFQPEVDGIVEVVVDHHRERDAVADLVDVGVQDAGMPWESLGTAMTSGVEVLHVPPEEARVPPDRAEIFA